MSSEKEQLNTFQFSVCPQCNGYGHVLTPARKHILCPLCQNKDSIFGYVDNQALYWNKKVNKALIAEEKTLDLIKRIINFVLVFLGVLGIISLGYYIFRNFNNPDDIISLIFKKDKFLLFFWLSILVDMFVYYRNVTEAAKKVYIKTRAFGADISPIIFTPAWKKLHDTEKNKINIAPFFNKEAMDAVASSYLIAEKGNQHEANNIDLLAAISTTTTIRLILARLGVDYTEYLNKIKRVLTSMAEKGIGLDFDIAFKKVLIVAYYEAYNNRRDEVTVSEILTALLKVDELVKEIFDDIAITGEKIDNVVSWIHLEKELVNWSRHYHGRAKSKPKNHMNKAMTARPTKLLDSVSQDYTLKAKMGHFFPLVGREKEVAEAFRILKEGKGNIILLGDAGVGKTTILEGVAQLMVAEDVPANLQDKRLVVLDPGVLIAGAAGVGGVEQRIVTIINEIMIAGNVILAIEDIHNLLGARSTGSGSDAGEILMNFLSQGYLKVIGTSTKTEYQKIVENKETFVRRFQVVKIEEMTEEDALKVLEARCGMAEYKSKVYFSYDALESCVKLTNRYIKDRYLPAKALDVMEESAIYAREKKGEKKVVSKEDVAAVLSEKTNVQVSNITEKEADKLLHLEEVMHERIVGQDEAITAIAKALRRSREELRDTKRPIANFLFLGPTGVGKTETAKTMAEVYFGNEENMIRVDMSEYREQRSIVKMIGDQYNPGYLTEAMRHKPFSLILLDEMEKAHPDILNLFLQVMDDGRLTDGRGRTIDFTNAIIIATSNAATELIQMGNQQGLTSQEIYDGLMNGYLDKFFRPEFINRFDRVVVFSSLKKEEVVEITRKMLAKLAQNLAGKGMIFEASEEAILELANAGYSPQYGARPMRRLLQDTVDDALAKLMLQQKIGRRDKIILLPKGELRIQKAQPL
ncbi:MAG: ATP-dependent Clp protease ATP-binding subunit [Patescibacteria group bacterium]|jgi:ATP-dependent Clp protease ATP-binding subunit ClpC